MVYAAQFIESTERNTLKEAQGLCECNQVAGPCKPRVQPDQPAKARASLMSEASFRSLQRRLKVMEKERKQEAADILASMTITITERAQTTYDEVLQTLLEQEAEEAPMVSSRSGIGLDELDSPLVEVNTEKRKLRPRKEKSESNRASPAVAARRSSKVKVKVPKHKVTKGPNMQARYNKFRSRTMALIGTEKIKAFRTGTLQVNVAFLWQQLSKEEQVAFDGRDEVEQREMLEKMIHPMEDVQKVTTIVKGPLPDQNEMWRGPRSESHQA